MSSKWNLFFSKSNALIDSLRSVEGQDSNWLMISETDRIIIDEN